MKHSTADKAKPQSRDKLLSRLAKLESTTSVEYVYVPVLNAKRSRITTFHLHARQEIANSIRPLWDHAILGSSPDAKSMFEHDIKSIEHLLRSLSNTCNREKTSIGMLTLNFETLVGRERLRLISDILSATPAEIRHRCIIMLTDVPAGAANDRLQQISASLKPLVRMLALEVLPERAPSTAQAINDTLKNGFQGIFIIGPAKYGEANWGKVSRTVSSAKDSELIVGVSCLNTKTDLECAQNAGVDLLTGTILGSPEPELPFPYRYEG